MISHRPQLTTLRASEAYDIFFPYYHGARGILLLLEHRPIKFTLAAESLRLDCRSIAIDLRRDHKRGKFDSVATFHGAREYSDSGCHECWDSELYHRARRVGRESSAESGVVPRRHRFDMEREGESEERSEKSRHIGIPDFLRHVL